VSQVLGVAADLVLKYAVVAVTLLLIMTVWGRLPWGGVLYAAVWVTVAAYLLGDLLVYRTLGNAYATMADFVIATAAVWVLSQMVTPRISLWMAVEAGAAVAVVEFFYHRYLGARGYRQPVRRSI